MRLNVMKHSIVFTGKNDQEVFETETAICWCVSSSSQFVNHSDS